MKSIIRNRTLIPVLLALWMSAIFIPESTTAQSINYFGVNNTIWTTVTTPENPYEHWERYQRYGLMGETIINDEKALVFGDIDDNGELSSTRGYISTQGEKVFYRLSKEDEPKLIYDFGLKPGDETVVYTTAPLLYPTWKSTETYRVKCLAINPWFDTAINAMVIEMTHLNSNSESKSDSPLQNIWWIGLGSPNNPVENDTPFWVGHGSSVREVESEGKIIFKDPFTSNSANPTTADPIVTIGVNGDLTISSGEEVVAVDLSGQIAKSGEGHLEGLSPGVYIVCTKGYIGKVVIP